MLKAEHKKLIHQQIILDLAIRTLERDRKLIDNLKSKFALEEWFEQKINQATKEVIKVKRKLSSMATRIEGEHKIDDLFTSYRILHMGSTEDIKYSNLALRNWTTEEIKRLLSIECNTADDDVGPMYHE